MRLLFSFSFIMAAISGFCQNFDKIPVTFTENANPLIYATAGGLKNGQFSNIDINRDGVKDLLVFDRSGNVVMPFIHSGVPGAIDYTYAPEYRSIFPELKSWVILNDFNNDGVEDIFTSSTVKNIPGCAEVWRGKIKNGKLTFEFMPFNYGIRDILMIPSGSSFTNIYISNYDIPAIGDADGDGDTDILSFDPNGSYLTFYENRAKDENLGNDTLKYVRNSFCWGGFYENDFSSELKLSVQKGDCAPPLTGNGDTGVRHSGSTSTLLDIDGDNDMDLLLGDLSSEKLALLVNGGDQKVAWITQTDNHFPAYDTPANIRIFLSSFYVDVNHDGKRDLLVTTNEENDAENKDHVWLYLNIGTDKAPLFRLHTKNFLVDQMVSMGQGSHPCLADVNQDGLTDLILGSNGFNPKEGKRIYSLRYYKNTGTEQNPAYTLENADFLGFTALGIENGRLAPTAGDLDGDGDTDIVIGDLRGFLYYFENKAGKNSPYQFAPGIYQYKNIFVGSGAKPHMADINGDGLADLVIGETNNELNYAQNRGSKGNPDFLSSMGTIPNTRDFGGFFGEGIDFNTQNGCPYLLEYEEDFKMLFGTESGLIKVFSNIRDNIYGKFNEEDPGTGTIREGRRVTISLAELDDDGYFEMAVGNERGGIGFFNTIFKTNTISSVSESFYPKINVFPNPCTDKLYINGEYVPEDIRIYNIKGEEQMIQLNQTEADVSHLSAGMYILKLIYRTHTDTAPVVIMR